MFLTSYIFKSKAVRALKGNWQTALVVAFIAGLPSTLNSLLRSTQMPEIMSFTLQGVWDAVGQIPPGTAWLLAAVSVVTMIVTPVLSISCNYYFIKRLQGEDLGFAGAVSRRAIFWRALWLQIVMWVKTFLWGLLFVVPGIMAMLRYAMAPYYLAEHPEMTAAEAINKSKEAMADKKTSLFMLMLSFVGWVFMATTVQILLLSFSTIISMVAYQFLELFVITYFSASVAAFYLAVSRTEGLNKAKQEADAFIARMQSRMPYGPDGGADDETQDDAPVDDAPEDDEPKDGEQ